jgi:hypothetical protein
MHLNIFYFLFLFIAVNEDVGPNSNCYGCCDFVIVVASSLFHRYRVRYRQLFSVARTIVIALLFIRSFEVVQLSLFLLPCRHRFHDGYVCYFVAALSLSRYRCRCRVIVVVVALLFVGISAELENGDRGYY